ncbi:MAG: hypothetical protein M5U22_14055 [Thermoleophilia bacterium]|nr:hypothetical protein [Thermoleophilia bacterium]
MTWIVDIDVVGIEEAEPPDALRIGFDVTFPGETWCRSFVLVAPERVLPDEAKIISAARDALVEVLQLQGEPVAVELRLAAKDTEILALGRPGG